MSISFSARLFAFFLKVSKFKIIIEKRASKTIRRSGKSFVPKRIQNAYYVNSQLILNKTVATFEIEKKLINDHVIFFHGGAYIFEASSGHWRFAEKVVKRSSCRMTLIDYPLAPEHSFKETYMMVEAAYKAIIYKYPNDNFILMGDSAGGGLALAFAQKIIKEKIGKPPENIILFSPWLDLNLSNPGMRKYEKSDLILTIGMLQKAASKYAGQDDKQQYLLSPINGDFTALPKTIVFYGSEELFHADCLKMQSLVKTLNTEFIFRKYQGMQHDWIVFPILESDQVVVEISQFLDNKGEEKHEAF